MNATKQTIQIQERYRINQEQGAFFPQRLQDGAWVSYQEMEYGRRYDKSFKSQSGAAKFLLLEWFKDAGHAVREAYINSGEAPDFLLKRVGLKRGQRY